MIAIDASAIVAALIADDAKGNAARRRLEGEQIAAPELLYLEVASVARRMVARGHLDPHQAGLALRDLDAMPLHVARHRWLLPRIWGLRENLSAYDAAYVALAEASECTLLTADARLARAPGLRCTVEVLADA